MRKPILIASAIALATPAFAQMTTNDDMSAPTTTSAATAQDHSNHDMATQTPTTQADMDMDMDMDAAHSPDAMGTTDTMATTDAMETSTMATDTGQATTMAYTTAPTMAAASGQVVQPGNDNPEHDARGIAVVSAPAFVPAGWNGVTTAAVGGPLVDAATGETGATDDYPACSASITDNCLQTYERGRS